MNAVLRFLRALLLATLLTPAATVHAAAPTDPQAETMLLLQTASGGWSKHYRGKAVDYRRPLSAVERDALRAPGRKDDATLDNKATTSEIRYLLQAHARTANPAYLQAARRGVNYLLAAQYPNGGWPQYYPDRSFYRHQITFNDDAMTRVLELLQDIVESRDEAALLAPEFGSAAQAALARGLDCVLATQVRIEGLPTLWAAQYDEVTLLPAKARSYELPSLAVAESVGVLRLLMRQRDPSPAQVAAVEAGVRWLQAHRLPDVALERVDAPEQESGRDVRIVQRPGARCGRGSTTCSTSSRCSSIVTACRLRSSRPFPTSAVSAMRGMECGRRNCCAANGRHGVRAGACRRTAPRYPRCSDGSEETCVERVS
jgi:pectinesterase